MYYLLIFFQFFSQSNIIVTRRTTPTTTLRTTEATTVRSGKPTRSPFDNPNRYKMPQANQQSDQVRFVNGRPYRYVHIYLRQIMTKIRNFLFNLEKSQAEGGAFLLFPFPLKFHQSFISQFFQFLSSMMKAVEFFLCGKLFTEEIEN